MKNKIDVGAVGLTFVFQISITSCFFSVQKEQLGLGEFDWLADMGLFSEQLPQEALAAAEVPQLPISPPTNVNAYRPPKFSMSHKKPRIEIDDDEYFTVPDLG
jgi:hypothetical protein